MFDIWLALLELENFPPPQAVEGFHQQMVKHARLTWFDIDLHKACQLTCDHCFYNDNYPKSKSPGLAPELLEEAIRQAFQAQIKILTFSGMEPTLSRNFEWAVRCARMARARYAPAAKIGLITNGLTLPRHLDRL